MFLIILERHEKAHANGQFKCEICDVKFSKLSFAWHQKIVHGIGNDRYRCKTCNEHFMRSNQLGKINLNFKKRMFNERKNKYFQQNMNNCIKLATQATM